jgi:hypothetical protein
MATAAYTRWNNLGRPLRPSNTVLEFVTRMEAQFPKAVNILGWYSNNAHYQANPPLDHTPYSADEWPNPIGDYVVYATDVMHVPNVGLDCFKLAPYWLSEARAGRFKALKYIIWQGVGYDVRNGFKGHTEAGHFDHAHLSMRTDVTTLGAWSVVPTGGEDVKPRVVQQQGTDNYWVTNGMKRWTLAAKDVRLCIDWVLTKYWGSDPTIIVVDRPDLFGPIDSDPFHM